MNHEKRLAHKSLKVEELRVNYRYAISINPSDVFTTVDPTKALFKIVNRMRCLIDRLHYSKYELFLESSPTGRFHYHGTMMISNIAQFIIYDLPLLMHDKDNRTSNTFEIDTIKDMQTWYLYITILNNDTYGNPFVKEIK